MAPTEMAPRYPATLIQPRDYDEDDHDVDGDYYDDGDFYYDDDDDEDDNDDDDDDGDGGGVVLHIDRPSHSTH